MDIKSDLLNLAHPFPARSAPGATLLSDAHTMLRLSQPLSSELSPQSFCELHVRVELMQRPAAEKMSQTCQSDAKLL